MQKKLFSRIILFGCFFLITVFTQAQTPGLVFKPATGGGAAILDPNGDGYVSQTTAGFTTNDQTQSELPYVAIPVPASEPTSDLGPGPNCGFTDFVDSGTEDPAMVYLSGASNWQFRFRMGNAAPNSKGYSILIDTDLKFGFSGPNADPNAVAGNPGFEVEISFQSNFGVYLYDVNGTLTPTLKASLVGDDYYQKAVALTTNCSNPDYFYDFYIPFATITGQFPTFTVNTPIRFAIITTMNPNPAIGNGALSDLGGIDDGAGGYDYDVLFQQVIDNFYPTSPTDLNNGTPGDRSKCPGVSSPIKATATSISGTSTEANGSTIKVFKNAVLLGTTTVSGGSWTLTGVAGLASNDIITATATAAGKSESYSNCDATTVGASCTAMLSSSALSITQKGICGTAGAGISGAEVLVYDGAGNLQTPNGGSIYAAGTVTINAGGDFFWKCNGNNSNCNSGGNCMSNGTYKVVQKNGASCESDPVYLCLGSGGNSTTPTITGPVLTSAVNVTGTATTGATVILYQNSTQIGTATAAAGAFTIAVSGLSQGDTLTAKAVESGKCISSASTNTIVNSQTAAPTITGTYCTTTTITSVSGSSSEASGTVIQVYENGVAEGSTTTVNGSGGWTASTGISIAIGSTITAKATATNKTQSVASTGVVVTTQTVDALAAVTGPITEGATSLSGTGTTGNTIKVYIDGALLGTVVAAGGTWSLMGLGASDVYAGGSVYVTSTSGANCASAASAGVTVDCITPSATLTVNPDSTGICANQTLTATIVSSENGIIYQLYNGASTSGSSKLGTGANINLTSAALTATTTLSVKAIKISPVTCTSTLNETIKVTVNPRPDSLYAVTDASICSGLTATITVASSQVGINYYLRKTSDNSVVYGPVAGTGAALNFSASPMATITYHIYAENATTGCYSILDDISTVTVSGSITTANAGPDQSLCTATTTTLAANAVAGGETGAWSVVSGNGNVTTGNNEASGVTGLTNDNTLVLVWSISKGGCSASTDTILIKNYSNSVGGTLSGNATVCPGNNSGTITLSGYTGTIQKWQSADENTFATPSNIANTTTTQNYTNLNDTTYYRVEIKNGACAVAYSSIATITVPASMVMVNTHPANTTVCAGTNTILTVAATSNQTLSYQWQVDAGSGFSNISNNATYTGATNDTLTIVSSIALNGYTYRCVVSNSCATNSNSNSATLTVNPIPTANAGSDITITCASTTTTLAAADPNPLNGQWTVLSGTATITDNTLYNSGVTGLGSGTVSLKWEVTNGTCADTDTMTITRDCEAVYTVNPSQPVNTYNNGDTLATVSDPDGAVVTAVVSNGSFPAGVSINGTTGVITVSDSTQLVAGTYNFDVITTDALGGTTTQTVTIVIDPPPFNNPPVAVNDSTGVNEDTALNNINVLGNDTDADMNTLSTSSASAIHGTVTINVNGTLNYMPASNFNGNDTITYVVCDNGSPSKCDTAIVKVTIAPVNDAPDASIETLTVIEDIGGSINALINDSDVDNDSLIITILSGPAHGSVSISNDSTIVYTPATNYTGNDTIFYQVCDNAMPVNACTADTLVITVTAVNDAPVAVNDSTGVNEDTALNNINVLGNDSDPENNTLSVSSASAAHGTVTVNGNGTLNYNPANNFNGTDTITYIVCDNDVISKCDTAIVIVTVVPVNDAPVSANDANSTEPLTMVSTDVVANDSDIDGDILTVTIVSGGSKGTATVNGNNIEYTPGVGFNAGKDTVVYAVCDPSNACDTAILVISVPTNKKPVAGNDSTGVNEDTTLTNINVLGNDTDPENDILSTSSASANHGTVTININGTINYTPANNFNGTDTITYVVCDNGSPSKCDTGIVIVTVLPVNDAPVTVTETLTVQEDTNGSVNVLTNDSDVENDSLTVTILSGPAHGGASVNNDSTITYTPANNYTGNDTIIYQVCDNATPVNACTTDTLVITVTPVNDAPVAANDSTGVNEDTVLNNINVLGNDTDLENDALSTSSASANHGTVTINVNGTINYTPANNFNGTDTITYVVCDNGSPSKCDTGIVVITVVPVNDAPVNSSAGPIIFNITAGDSISDCITYADVDAGDTHTVSVTTNGNGVLTSNDTCFKYVTPAGQTDSDTIKFVVCDNNGACDTTLVVVNYTPSVVNQNPVITPGTTSTTLNEDSNKKICFSITDADAADTTFTITTGCMKHGTATINDTCITYKPAANYHGKDTLCVLVCDKNGGCDTAYVYFDVLPVNDPPILSENPVIFRSNYSGDTLSMCISFTDADLPSDQHTVSVTSPSPGVLTSSDTCFKYVTSPTSAGIDSVYFVVCDTSGACDTTLIVLSHVPFVKFPPVINPSDTSITVPEDGSTLLCFNITDPNTTDTVFTITAGCYTHGTVYVTGNCIQYKPDTNYVGKDSICVIACDQSGKCDTAYVHVTVSPVNDPPVNDEDGPITVVTTAGTQVSDCIGFTDVDLPNDAHTVTVTSTGTGALIVTDTCFKYTPPAGNAGIDTLYYIVCDTAGLCDTTVVVIKYGSTPVVNHKPIAVNDTINCDDQNNVSFNVLPNDSDPDGDNLTATIITPPVHGTIYGTSPGQFTYNATNGYCGLDSARYKICDSGTPQLCDTATIYFNVTPYDQDGDGIPDYKETTADVDGDGLANLADLDSDNDNIPDSIENPITDMCATIVLIDTDNDGKPNYNDTNSDGDERSDAEEGVKDCDNDGIPNYIDASDICVDNIVIPEGFSPNGDGVNDLLVIEGLLPFQNNSIKVFNRWGNIVYEKTGYVNDWNGTANKGVLTGSGVLPSGTYYYILELGDSNNTNYNGYIYLNNQN